MVLRDIAGRQGAYALEVPFPGPVVPLEIRPQKRRGEKLEQLLAQLIVPPGEVAPEIDAEDEPAGLESYNFV